MSDDVKTSHSLRVLSRLSKMREDQFICDFSIRVGNESFPTHRTILAASSDYFKGLFTSDMKEAMEGFVEVKGLGVQGIKRSIEFMYNEDVHIALESVEDTLHASDFFQLDGLKELCFQYLLKNISPNNCLLVASLARTYARDDVLIESEHVAIENMNEVIDSDMFSFISRSDLLRYISKLDCEMSWRAAVAWAKSNNESSLLIDAINTKDFPFKFLWQTVLEEPQVKKSESVREVVVLTLFSNAEELRSNLLPGNCIFLLNLARDRNMDDTAVEVITGFMKANFDEIVVHPSFGDLEKDDVIALFSSPETNCSSETLKWESTLKWVNHSLDGRKRDFVDIFSLITLDEFPSTYLRDQIRSERLVQQSKKCVEMLVDVLMTRSVKMEETLSTANLSKHRQKGGEEGENSGATSRRPALITCKQPSGLMWRKILWRRHCKIIEITFDFPGGSCEGMSYSAEQFVAYLPNNTLGQNLFFRVSKAFHAGQLFKLVHFQGKVRGEIVCDDVPFKARKFGGIAENGYPDAQCLRAVQQLRRSLEMKGF